MLTIWKQHSKLKQTSKKLFVSFFKHRKHIQKSIFFLENWRRKHFPVLHVISFKYDFVKHLLTKFSCPFKTMNLSNIKIITRIIRFCILPRSIYLSVSSIHSTLMSTFFCLHAFSAIDKALWKVDSSHDFSDKAFEGELQRGVSLLAVHHALRMRA